MKLNDVLQANLSGEVVESLPVDDFGSYFGEKSFLLERVAHKQKLGDDHAKDGVTQIFQSLVGFSQAAVIDSCDAAMAHGQLVE